MPGLQIELQEIKKLKQFYKLMTQTRELRFKLVGDIFNRQAIDSESVESLKNALAALENIPAKHNRQLLLIDDSKQIKVDLTYETDELKKDIYYLDNGEDKFIQYLDNIHTGFMQYVNDGVEKLKGLHFNCLISDRDGTTNNYCGRYRSSIQSIYNSVFLTRFAKKKVDNPIIVTSAPLKDPGIVDVSVNPEKTIVYAASKGREFIDLTGTRRSYPVDDAKQVILNRLNEKLVKMVNTQEYEKYSLIGSGLQLKFGQTTIARQDISNSIGEEESLKFLSVIKEMVSEFDPEYKNFRIEDTGLDVEIILTIDDESSGSKDFDKADAVRYLDSELNLNLDKGPHLVCGDTASDVPMITAAMESTKDTYSIFVTKKEELAQNVRAICPGAIIVPEPDMLVTIMGLLST
ncbi:MAG TPA: trehalose 6-phosphate synthase [Desulfobacterales bacterium]|nr:trehalose 6-phosphate synthase [Desulfobacterales bacterium]